MKPSLMNDEQFVALARSAQKRIRVAVHLEASALRLSERSGIAPETIEKIASANEFSSGDALLSELKGKDWARLLGAVGIYAEDWAREAKVDPEHFTAGEFVASSGERPTPEMDKKVRGLIGLTSEFYAIASKKYLQKHGRNPSNLAGTCFARCSGSGKVNEPSMSAS